MEHLRNTALTWEFMVNSEQMMLWGFGDFKLMPLADTSAALM